MSFWYHKTDSRFGFFGAFLVAIFLSTDFYRFSNNLIFFAITFDGVMLLIVCVLYNDGWSCGGRKWVSRGGTKQVRQGSRMVWLKISSIIRKKKLISRGHCEEYNFHVDGLRGRMANHWPLSGKRSTKLNFSNDYLWGCWCFFFGVRRLKTIVT